MDVAGIVVTVISIIVTVIDIMRSSAEKDPAQKDSTHKHQKSNRPPKE